MKATLFISSLLLFNFRLVRCVVPLCEEAIDGEVAAHDGDE
jgi:hypothetical protein